MATSTEIQALINTLAAKTGEGSITPAEVAAIMSALNVNAAENYSTTETLTGGTWIDGKPIYRKVIQFTLPNGVFESDLTSLNIEHCLKCSANLLDDNHQSINEQLLVLRDAVSQFYSRVIFPNLLEVAYMMTEITTGETSFKNVEMSGSVILEYTKTTD